MPEWYLLAIMGFSSQL